MNDGADSREPPAEVWRRCGQQLDPTRRDRGCTCRNPDNRVPAQPWHLTRDQLLELARERGPGTHVLRFYGGTSTRRGTP